MTVEIIEKELSYKFVQSANALEPGFPENFYEEAMAIELPQRGHRIERQKQKFSSRESKLVRTFLT